MQETIYSAVFVDFDNIYLGLTNTKGAAAANSFATDPAAWLNWLTRYTGVEGASTERASSWLSWLRLNKSKALTSEAVGVREIIVRRCYLNPQSFWRYRQPFAQTGFEIVDCPSLTQKNKSGADIRIVLDIMDLLQQRDPVINEFIIMSGDADFTPVVLRLRQRGRRIMVLVARKAASAYLAAANAVIDSDEFETKALSDIPLPEPEPLPEPRQSDNQSILSKVDDLIKSELIGSDSPVRGAVVAQKIANRFDTSDWFGYGSFRSFMEERLEIMKLKYAVQGTRDYIYDPTRHAHLVPAILERPTKKKRNADLLPRIDTFITDTVADSTEGVVGGGTMAKLLQDRFGTGWYGYESFKDFINSRAPALGLEFYVQGTVNQLIDPNRYTPSDGNGQDSSADSRFDINDVDQCIADTLARSEAPILGARMAQIIADGFDTDGWFGFGRFKNFLTERAEVLQLAYTTSEDGRTWIFDPNRHENPHAPDIPCRLTETDNSDLLSLVAPIAETSGLPLLKGSIYQQLFTKIVEEVNQNSYDYESTLHAVQEQFNAEGVPVAVLEIKWVLDAFEQVEFSFNVPSQVTPSNLASYFHDYVRGDINDRQGALNEDQEDLLVHWLRSG